MYPYIYIVLPSYVVLAFVGMFIALIFMFFRLEKYQIAFSDFLKIFFFCIVGGYIGSKILFVATKLPWLLNNFSANNFVQVILRSGFVFYGGLLGVIFSAFMYTRKDKGKRERVIKLMTPAIPLFHAFGRIGCFFAGCCYGEELGRTVKIFGGVVVNRIPVQLIEAGFEMVLFVVILAISKYKEKINILNMYLICYAVFRVIIEFWRGDDIRGIYFGISTSQWISLAIILTIIITKVRIRKNKFDSFEKDAIISKV